MGKVIHHRLIKAGGLLRYAMLVSLAIILALLIISMPGTVNVGATAIGAEANTEVAWQSLPGTVPKDAEQVVLKNTHDFMFSIWRHSDGFWKDEDHGVRFKSSGSNDKDLLLAALDKEIEFKMELPPEILEEMKQGHSVAVAAVGGWALNIDDLFYLNGRELQYKLDDQFLFIKGYPKIHFVDDVTLDWFLPFIYKIPFPQTPYGYMGFSMYELNGKHLGSASGYLTEAYFDEFKTENAQGEEIEYANGRKMIHPSQISDKLDGHLAGDFEVAIYEDGNEYIRSSEDVTIGTGGSLKGGAAVGLLFTYPLELTFYVKKIEDVAVVDIKYGELLPLCPATATVTVTNHGNTAHDTLLKFSIPSLVNETQPVRDLKPGERQKFEFGFTTPEAGFIEMTAEINQERAFEELDYENNKLTVVATMGNYGDLPYWVISRKIKFSLPPATASFDLREGGWWTGRASGTLKVENISPDIYRDFRADNYEPNENIVDISVVGGYGYISYRALINSTLRREDFGDDPLGKKWAANNNKTQTGYINTGVAVRNSERASEPYEYYYECGGCRTRGSGENERDYCPGHIGTGTDYDNFSNVGYNRDYTANIYNGVEELPYEKEFDRFTERQAGRDIAGGNKEYQYDLHWEGTHYPLNEPLNNNSPSKVVRWMCHLDENGAVDNEEDGGWVPVPAQYQRTFVGQSTGTVTWETVDTMKALYKPDRDNARVRETGKFNYIHAVFATDKQFFDIEYPIKSGYYFNPVGKYKCTVKTAQYKDIPNATYEHKELVEKVREAFCYDSALVYVSKDGNAAPLDDITEDTTGYKGNLLKIETTTEAPVATKLETSIVMDSEIDELFQEVLEGYGQPPTDTEPGSGSWTGDSYLKYKYREYTNKNIWLVEEETVIEFEISVPSGQKLYTYPHMKNGEYKVLVRVNDIDFHFDHYEHNGVLKMDAFIMDAIKVTVSGSIHDDVNQR